MTSSTNLQIINKHRVTTNENILLYLQYHRIILISQVFHLLAFSCRDFAFLQCRLNDCFVLTFPAFMKVIAICCLISHCSFEELKNQMNEAQCVFVGLGG